MKAQDLLEHAWVEEWLLSRPGTQTWTALEWKSHFLKLSKTLSYILRHGAAENDLVLREDGYIRVAVLLAHGQFSKFGFTEEELILAVEKNAKQRFAVKREGNALFIRAQQGHTGKVGHINQHAVNTTLTSIDVPDCVVHGTAQRKLEPILREGLKTMGRDHIHMATGLPGDGEVISGCRTESDAFLKINAKMAISDGIEFLLSGNGVILTAGRGGVLPPKYIECVMDRWGNITRTVNATSQPAQQSIAASSRFNKRPLPQEQAATPVPVPPSPEPSQLSLAERNFLKQVKKVRAILKIQEMTGPRDGGQEKKLAALPEALQELAEEEQKLSKDSDLREKNQDVLRLCCAEP